MLVHCLQGKACPTASHASLSVCRHTVCHGMTGTQHIAYIYIALANRLSPERCSLSAQPIAYTCALSLQVGTPWEAHVTTPSRTCCRSCTALVHSQMLSLILSALRRCPYSAGPSFQERTALTQQRQQQTQRPSYSSSSCLQPTGSCWRSWWA
jgi:hypothetical protein